LCLFVDSDHASEQITRCLSTGYVIYLNMAPLVWFSKRHPTVESIVFGAEFVAMKNGIETCSGLRYKLRTMGVRLGGTTYIHADNMSVVHNTQSPESFLKKNQCRFVTMRYVSLILWENHSLGMCLLLKILLKFALRLCRVGRSGTI
jgi:hypothetical protein